MSDLLSPADVSHLKSIASDAYDSKLLSPEIRSAQAAFFVAAVGAELGLSPIQSLQSIYVIKGKAILSSHAVLAIVMRRRDICKYFRLVESTPERATYETLRDGSDKPSSLTYTIEDAKRANLLNNPTWKSHPAAMLRARCGTALARATYPDLVLGVYDESEAEEIRGDLRGVAQEPVIRIAPEPARTIEAAPEPAQLPAASQAQTSQAPAMIARIYEANTIAVLQGLVPEIKALSEADRDAVRAPYAAQSSCLTLINRARVPGTDLEKLTEEALHLKGLTPAQEQLIATALADAREAQ